MVVRVIKRKDGVYDVYDRATGKWLLSRLSPDNVLSWLSSQVCLNIDFIDETVGEDGVE